MTDDEGRCRFNCMTGRETWLACYRWLTDHQAGMWPTEDEAKEAHRKWRKEQRDTD